MAESLIDGDLKFFYSWPAPADIRISGTDLVRDPGLENAVLISLFSDSRAAVDDQLPDKNDTRRGWWGDTLIGSPVGSKVWLSDRSKIVSQSLVQQEQHIAEALAWMKSDGIASKIEAKAARSTLRTDEIIYSVTITAPSGMTIFFKYYYNWKTQTTGSI